MPDKQPIDYARAGSSAVRKKFRQRVVMFVIATVVLIVIGGGWVHSACGGIWNIGDTAAMNSSDGWVRLKTVMYTNTTPEGIDPRNLNARQYTPTKLHYEIRYRTLLLLALIPWIITLIRLVRFWKIRRVLSVE